MTRLMKFRHPEIGRVLTEDFDLSDFPRWGTRAEARKAQPYKVGDVIRVREGRDAIVVTTFVARLTERDHTPALLPMLHVCERTKSGDWSKQWRAVWPGEIQRGFKAAQQLQEVSQ